MLPPSSLSEVPLLLRRLRTSRGWSRAQIARRMKLTEPSVYNMELGRTRITLSVFFMFLRLCKIDVATALSNNLFSIQSKSDIEAAVSGHGGDCTAKLVAMFRSRLKYTQKQMGLAMGYSSSSMCHHFEKGIREASVTDLLNMMSITEDNIRGFILAISGDSELASKFPEGLAAKMQTWEEYWSDYYISAIRQIMRSDVYRKLSRYRLGFFSDVLGISVEEERHGLAVLARLGIARLDAGKPVIDPSVRILIPQNISKEILTKFKISWANYAMKRFMKGDHDQDLFTVDLIHANPKIFGKIIKMIRRLQDEIHNEPLADTSGFMCLTWMGSFTSVQGLT